MSVWRRKALEFLPIEKVIIESAESPGELWIELTFIFDKAVPNNKNIIDSILKYADWCTNQPDINTYNAVSCGFMEDITRNHKHWPEFKNWFNLAQYEKYKGSFSYAMSEKEFEQFENIYFER